MHVVATPEDMIALEPEYETQSVDRSPIAITLAVLGHLVGALIIAGYLVFLAMHFQPAISEPDDNGYFAQASLMATKGTTVLKPESDAQYLGMHWLVTSLDKNNEQYISRYPFGLPALIALVYKIGGYKAAAAVNPAVAVGALIGLYLLLCRIVPIPLALAGVVLVATNPTFTHHALDGDSHMGVTFCLMGAFYFMLLWSKGKKLWQAALAGLFLGCIPTVRYGDIVMLSGAAVFMLWQWRTFRLIFPYFIAAGLGVLAHLLPQLFTGLAGVKHFELFCDGAIGVGAVFFLLWQMGVLGDGRSLWVNEEDEGSPLRSAESFRFLWRHYLLAGVVSALPLLPLLIRNQRVMGAFWRTGYSLTNEETGFSMDYFKAHAVEYLQQVQGAGIGLFFGLGLVGMVWMACVKRTRALGLMLLLATTSMLLLYMAYYWAPQQNSQMTMRFLLPTFPLYVIAGMWLLAEALAAAPAGARIVVPLAVVAVQLAWGTTTMLDETTQGTYQRQLLATVTEAMQKHVPAGAVVLADGHTLQDLDFVRIWKTADMSLAGVGGGGFGGGGGNANRRIGGNNRTRNRAGGGGFGNFGGGGDNNPSPRQEEKSEVAASKYTGTTEQRIAKFEKDIRAWGGGNKVYFVGTRDQMEQTFGQMADLGHDVVVIADHIPLPPEPAEAPREGMMGAGGPPGGQGGPGGPGGPGGFAGVMQQAMRRRGGGGGGMFGSAMAGEKEFVIAEWTIPNS